MSIVDAVTLLLAFWGAALSTYLGIRELLREKRSLRVFLDLKFGFESYQVVIVNTGYRPVTISSVSVQALPAHKGVPDLSMGEEVGPMISEKDEKKLPATLNDGEAMTLAIGSMPQDLVSHGKGRLEVVVYDVEGNAYKAKKARFIDTDGIFKT